MRAQAITVVMVVGGILMARGMPEAVAADSEVSVSLLPVRYIDVDGDAGKFQAHHWMKDRYTGGLKEFTTTYTLPDGTRFSSEAHALIDQNDLGAELSLKKEGVGFVGLDYSEFRKYFDNNGGVHRRFRTLRMPTTDKELALDIGKLALETGLALEGWPALAFEYEREFKDGAKSRLNWTAVKDDGETRYIGPSWQDVDEMVDVFALKANHAVAGFALSGEQRWERVRSELFREERLLSTSSAASDKKMRRQDQAPESTLMTTTLGADRHFLDGKVFYASGYHFAHMESREFESLLEFNENGVLTAFSNPKMQINARADNDYDTHTWVHNLTLAPWPWLSFNTKLKAEVVKRQSNSSYPGDTGEATATGGTPDGVIDKTEVSLNDTKATRWGEGFSLRFTGLPRTALYTELELEQSRVLMREDRKSLDGPDTGNGSDANEVFNRETVTDVRRGAWTLGGQVAPWPFFNMTAHVRHRRNNNDYDDQRESNPGSSTARSAFIDEQNVHTDEFATRLTLRPCRWFRSSFRYQLRDDDYMTRAEAEAAVKTGMRSHIYTYDVVLQPISALVTTASFSRQNAATTTPARLASSANTPTFNADVNTWLLSADYTLPKPAVTLASTLQYSRAKNFNDFANTGLPLGVDSARLDLTSGVQWAVREDTSVGVEYAFYHYGADSNAEFGDYDAHALWLEVSQEF